MVVPPSEDRPTGNGAQVKDSPTQHASVPEDSGLSPTSKTSAKVSGNDQFLDVPQSRPSLDTLSGFSTYSLEDFSAAARPTARSLNSNEHVRLASRSPAPPRSVGGRWQQIWQKQKGVVLMILAQLFGAAMATTARFMETSDEHGHPMSTFQILFVRMSITMVSSLAYMWWAKVPDAPFGAKEVRTLLLARGFGGFFGVFGLYYSLVYLPLAEATVITFLAPMVAAWVCSVCIGTAFTRTQQMAFVMSLCGVILIAQPFSFLKHTADSHPAPASNSTEPATISNSTNMEGNGASPAHKVTPGQHIFAVAMGLLGVCGAACAYTTISWIGKRAHPLISVSYFAVWCTIVSTVALIFAPGVSFRLPSGVREWMLMAFLGFSGFVMQYLLTAALAHTGGGKGLNMVYTQMLFALAFDKLVWGTSPGVISIVGSSLILGSAIWVAMKRDEKKEAPPAERPDEEEGLVDSTGDDDADDDNDNDTRQRGSDAGRGILSEAEMELPPGRN